MSMRPKRANPRGQGGDRIASSIRDYRAATLLDFWASPRSITVLHPALSSARCVTMHALIFGILGISQLHRRKRVTGAHLLRFGAEGKVLGRRQRGQRDGKSQHQAGLTLCPDERCGRSRLPLVSPDWRRVAGACWCRNRPAPTVTSVTPSADYDIDHSNRKFRSRNRATGGAN
jgi:hypothetical protein